MGTELNTVVVVWFVVEGRNILDVCLTKRLAHKRAKEIAEERSCRDVEEHPYGYEWFYTVPDGDWYEDEMSKFIEVKDYYARENP